MESMKILLVAAEMAPLAQVGGLGDVVGSLPAALTARGHDVRVLIPAYQRNLTRELETRVRLAAGKGRIVETNQASLPCPVWLLETPGFLRRRGRPYLNKAGTPWADNAVQFGMLSRVAADIACGRLETGWQPDIVHSNDWHTGLTPVWMRLQGAAAASVFTIHNAGFSGCFPPEILERLELPDHLYQPDGLEFYGSISLLKAGINFADRITTVSPSYAEEIQTPEFGGGMDGLLRARSGVLSGILNGIDYAAWNPATDPRLTHHFDSEHPEGKASQRQELIRELGLAFDHSDRAPVIVWVGRLTEQKGIDLLLEAMPELMKKDLRLVVLGAGAAQIESELHRLARRHEGRLSVHTAFDEDRAHQLYAGADMLLMPSRFEPCGLVQMIAMRYGTIPLVTGVGGLRDTVKDLDSGLDSANGLRMSAPEVGALLETVDRALALYEQKDAWKQLMGNAMRERFEWLDAATAYENLYRDALGERMKGHYPRVA
ncbi:starch synthase [Halospina denitrificans]|uniref:Glycogen synthase n=1 Tax=Halospina denitrificans TaxID=332522 RepID=A0A4R7JUB6_9GAMM|nr:glycogen synthase GlgA [Halospina denitrificans]TDT41426.1 starch synthase [Halospina denitrificans]